MVQYVDSSWDLSPSPAQELVKLKGIKEQIQILCETIWGGKVKRGNLIQGTVKILVGTR